MPQIMSIVKKKFNQSLLWLTFSFFFLFVFQRVRNVHYIHTYNRNIGLNNKKKIYLSETQINYNKTPSIIGNRITYFKRIIDLCT